MIPEDFTRRMTEVHGDAGAEWCRDLPALIDSVAERWNLEVFNPFEPLSYNYVAPARCADGKDVVLKLGVPNPELTCEIHALCVFRGGIVKILEGNAGESVMLLERLLPGTTLAEVNETKANGIAARVMKQLWCPVPIQHSFPHTQQWADGLGRLRDRFNGGCGPFPERLISLAENRFKELFTSQSREVLLHGDLHHENILSAGMDQWLAIDPKGVIGEPEYEVGALLRNPIPQLLQETDPARTLARRVDQMADELEFDRKRILGWGLAQAVLSAWWAYEDHGYGWEWGITCARLLAKIEKE